jgi:hypothetical protein
MSLVASHDATRWSFSENTDLSEVLVVGRKRGADENSREAASCKFINLWKNPATTADALSLGESVNATASVAPISDNGRPMHGVTSLNIGAEKWGEAISIPRNELQNQPWLGCAFAHTELVRANWQLRQGRLTLPGRSRF